MANKKQSLSSGLMDVLGSFATANPIENSHADKSSTENTRKEIAIASQTKTSSNKETTAARRLWSFRIKEEVYRKITAISYWDRKNIQTVMDEILDKAIEDYERQNGEIVDPKA